MSIEKEELQTPSGTDATIGCDSAAVSGQPNRGSTLRVRCPHCQNLVDTIQEDSLSDVICNGCGSHFSLVDSGAQTRTAAIQKTLGHFDLVERLGVGAYGEVWKARDRELDRTVAIKVPRKGSLDAVEAEKFLREARAAAQLKHPNIVGIHEVGRQDDTVYIVSDLVRGLSLADWLTGQRPTVNQAAKICQQIAGALHHAHEKGVVHRDLKPANIMLDDEGQPHVMDFGLARRDIGDVTMTIDGQVLGTPAYMSPEQARGEAHSADRRSDVYSLGVILYELLTGTVPFRGNIRMIIHQVINDEPPSPRKLNNYIPRDLETVCLKCLEKNADNRYATAQDVADELGRYLKGEPVRARPISRLARTWRWCRRNPVVASLTGLAAALLLVITVISAAAYVQTRSSLAVAQVARDAAQAESQRANLAESAAKDSRQEAERARDEEQLRAYTATLAAALADIQRNDSRSARRRLEQTAEKLRGWEWRYLWNEADRSLGTPLVLPPKNGGYTMHLSLDGTLVASREIEDYEAPIRVFDARTGEAVTTLATVSSNSPVMTFSRDNKLLAYSHWGTPGVQIYDLKTGQTFVRRQHDYSKFLAFDAAGEHAYLVDRDSKIRLYRIRDWQLIATLPGLGNPNSSCRGRISPDGKYLAIDALELGRPNLVRVYDLAKREMVAEFSQSRPVVRLSFTSSGKNLVTVNDNSVITGYEAGTWKSITEVTHPIRGPLTSYEVDGRPVFLTFDSGNAVVILDRKFQIVAKLHGHQASGFSIAVDSERNEIVTAHEDGIIKRWDLRHPQRNNEVATSLAFSSREPLVQIGRSDKGNAIVDTIDAASGLALTSYPWYPHSLAHSHSAEGLAMSPDGRRLAIVTTNGWGAGRWRILDLWTGLSLKDDEPKGMGDLQCVDWSGNGRWIAVGGNSDKTPQGIGGCVYDAQDFRTVFTFPPHGNSRCLAYSPDSKYLVVGSQDGTTIVRSLPTGDTLQVLGQAGDAAVNCLRFLAEPDHLVTSSADGAITVWNARTGKQLHRFIGHGSPIRSLAFLPEGSRLASGTDSGSLTIWNSSNWRELVTLHLDDSARALGFNRDGTQLMAATSGGLVSLDAVEEVRRASERRLARDSSREGKAYVETLLAPKTDLAHAHERLLADESLSGPKRIAAIRSLQTRLYEDLKKAYDADELRRIVLPYFARRVLRKQLALKEASYRVDHSSLFDIKEFIAEIAALPTAEPLRHQALADYASACRMGFADTDSLAWSIVAESNRTPEEYTLALFGMERMVEEWPSDPKFLQTLGVAQFRAGMFPDAIASLERAAKHRNPKVAVWLTIVDAPILAMCHHRMGRTEQANLLLVKGIRDNAAMTKAVESASLELVRSVLLQGHGLEDDLYLSLFKEALQVVKEPTGAAFDEATAWKSVRERLIQANAERAAYAIWLTKSAWTLTERKHQALADQWQAEGIGKLKELGQADHKYLSAIAEDFDRFDDVVTALSKAKEHQAAVEFCRASIAELQRLASDKPREVVYGRQLRYCAGRLGDLFLEQGQFELAAEEYRRALEVAEQLAKQHPLNEDVQRDMAIVHWQLLNLRLRQGEFELALQHDQQNVEIRGRLARANLENDKFRREWEDAFAAPGNILWGLGKTADAIAQYTRAIKAGGRGHKLWTSRAECQQILGSVSDDVRLPPEWQDLPLETRWKPLNEGVANRIRTAQGVMAERFAFCQSLPLIDFQELCGQLRPAGYRPVRCRPYLDGDSVKVAAVWTRDASDWHLVGESTAEEIKTRDQQELAKKFVAVDVCGYFSPQPDGSRAVRYAAIWAEPAQAGTQTNLSVEFNPLLPVVNDLRDRGFSPRVLNKIHSIDGQPLFCGIFVKPASSDWNARWDIVGTAHPKELRIDLPQIDISVMGLRPPETRSASEILAAELKIAAEAIEADQTSVEKRLQRGKIQFYSGMLDEAIKDFSWVIEKQPESASAYGFRALTWARLKKPESARPDLERCLALTDKTSSYRAYFEALTGAYLGNHQSGVARLEQCIQEKPENLYNAACVYSLISAVAPEHGEAYAIRAIELLKMAIKARVDISAWLPTDHDMDPLRSRADFQEVLRVVGSQPQVCQFTGVWEINAQRVSHTLYGLSPEEHLARSQELVSLGYRSIAISVSPTIGSGALTAASVWQRPTTVKQGE